MRKKKNAKKRVTEEIKIVVRSLKQRLMAVFLLFLMQVQLFAGIVPDPITIGTRVTTTSTGIDQVDIARPNANGTSYNAYKEFDVDEKGLILNNNIYIVVNTELAGLIARNRNLDGPVEAKLIINDVTGNKGSTIKGIIEIGGAKADVVIANRNGININGGGFINVGYATLTTGRLTMKDGDLAEIQVDQGHLGIGSKGLDATRLESLDISGKTIGIDGPIKGSDQTKLRVSAGSQNINYRTKKVTSKGKTYEGVAIDGKALGSMYAGKIDVIANDKGAGVNLKGDLISLDDMTLTSGGKLTTSGKVKSAKKVRYKAEKAVRVENELYAGEKAEIKGAEVELAAKVVAGYENSGTGVLALEITGTDISSTGEIEVFGTAKVTGETITNSGTFVADEEIALAAGNTTNSGEIASGKVGITGKTLDNSGVIQTTDLKVVLAGITNSGLIQTTEIGLTADEITNSGIISVEKGISAKGSKLYNAGVITTPGALHFAYDEMGNIGGLLYGEKEIVLEGLTLDNTDGVISTLGNMTLTIKDITGKRGTLSAENLAITSDNLSNEEGTIHVANFAADLVGTLNNNGGAIVSEKSIRITARDLLSQYGVIYTDGELVITTSNLLDNKGGTIVGMLDTLGGNTLINEEGQILTNKELTLASLYTNNTGGEIFTPERIIITGDTFVNDGGYLHTNKGITITVTRASNRDGFILSDGLTKEMLAAMEEAAAAEDEPAIETPTEEELLAEVEEETPPELALEEEAEVILYDGIALIANTLDNTKGIIRSLGDLVITADTTNDGGALIGANIDYTGNLLNKDGTVSASAISITGNITGNSGGSIAGTTIAIVGATNNNGGILSAGTIDVTGNVTGNANGIITGQTLTIAGAVNNNSGTIQASTIDITGNVTGNADGTILGQSVALTGSVNNNSGDITGETVTITGSTSNNSGTIQAGIFEETGNLTANAKGTIAADTIEITGNVNNTSGTIEGNEVALAGTVTNNSGTLRANELEITKGPLTNAYGLIETGNLTAKIGNFNNNYGTVTGLGSIILTNVSNDHGKIISDNYIEITNSGNLNNNYGAIESKSAESGVIVNIGGTLLYTGGHITSLGTVSVTTGGDIVLDSRLEGKVATIIDANTIRVTSQVDRTGILELTGRNGFDLQANVAAKTLSLTTNVGLTVNHTLNGKEGLYINAHSLENSGLLTSNANTAVRLGKIDADGNVQYTDANQLKNYGTITSGGDTIIIGGRLYNLNGATITAKTNTILMGNHLDNITTATRDGNAVTVGTGSKITGTNVQIQVSGTVINGFYDVGGTSTRADGTIKDNRTVTGGAFGTIAGTTATQIEAGNLQNRGNIGYSGKGATYIEVTGQLKNERTGNYGNANILGATVVAIGKAGVINTGALIKGTTSTYVAAPNGTIVNQSTVKDGAVIYTHQEEKSIENSRVYDDYRLDEEIPGLKGLTISRNSQTTITNLTGLPADIVAAYNSAKAAGKPVRVAVSYRAGYSGGGDNGSEEPGVYTFEVLEAYTVVDIRGEGLNNIGTIESDGIVVLEGKNITNIGAKIAGIGGTSIKATEDIKDTSIVVSYSYKGSDKYIEDNSYYGNKDWDEASGTFNISGQIGQGGTTQLTAGRDINLINSYVQAAADVVLYADRYINSLAVNDTLYRYDYDKSKSGSIVKTTRIKTWTIDDKYANGTEIYAGGNILMNYGAKDADGKDLALKNRGVFLQGTDMYAEGGIAVKSLGNIYTQGTKDDLYHYDYSKKSRSLIGIKISSSSHSRTADYESYNLTNFYGSTGFMMDSNDKLTIEGASIYTNGNLYLRGRNGVELRPGMASSYYLEVYKKSGLSANLSIGKGGLSAGIGYGKMKSV
ncbi:MAG: filamentous hemagglutinin N-terminal domain-containing protein, partial [Fusobacteriaceae bacterium]|nr:filamentous hemagglutinin N-terminal domain-containing protein [Fusobacteriaceae bacterium]